MENEKLNSNNNWLSLFRRKIQKKFKRNRQKVCENENQQNENHNENLEEDPTPELPAEQEINQEETNTSDESNSTIQNGEEMKKELAKLKWYWPNLK
jgi:hypothetical protein